MATYAVSAVVRGREIGWSFDNSQQAMRFWGKMKESQRTPDTDDAVSGGSLFRDGKSIDKLSDAPYGGLVVA